MWVEVLSIAPGAQQPVLLLLIPVVTHHFCLQRVTTNFLAGPLAKVEVLAS